MVKTKEQYDGVMQQLNFLMNKGSENVSPQESVTIRLLAEAVQVYEQKVHQIKAPQTLGGILELIMFESKMKQNEFALFLGISETKLSFILNGKRKPDVKLLKILHSKLHIDASTLLIAA